MPRALVGFIALILGGFAAINGMPNAVGQTGPGWVQLFDGKTLAGWDPMPGVEWRVEDSALVADKKTVQGNPSLVSKNSYKDFEIYAEFWVSADANSGIYIRCTEPKNVSSRSAYEVNIFDTRPEQKYGTGAIVDVAEVNPIAKGRRPLEHVRDHGQGTVDDGRDERYQDRGRQG
jgi:hypothetical protein